MKIQVQVRQMMFGYIEVEVPDENPIYNPQATARMKRNAAKKLAQTAIANGTSEIKWDREEFLDGVGKSYYEISGFVPVIDE